jgi:hypothetical protein
MEKFTPEYLESQKQKKRAWREKYMAKYYLEVIKPKRNKKCVQTSSDI